MNYQKFVGYPLDYVIKELDNLSIKYKIIESSKIDKAYDILLVVKIVKTECCLEITTDKFLMDIGDK